MIPLRSSLSLAILAMGIWSAEPQAAGTGRIATPLVLPLSSGRVFVGEDLVEDFDCIGDIVPNEKSLRVFDRRGGLPPITINDCTQPGRYELVDDRVLVVGEPLAYPRSFQICGAPQSAVPVRVVTRRKQHAAVFFAPISDAAVTSVSALADSLLSKLRGLGENISPRADYFLADSTFAVPVSVPSGIGSRVRMYVVTFDSNRITPALSLAPTERTLAKQLGRALQSARAEDVQSVVIDLSSRRVSLIDREPTTTLGLLRWK